MGLLLDTVNDALRPLPPALVLRRSAAGDDEVAADEPPAGDPGALTVYRLQKEGGRPPAAPPHGPSAIGQGALRGAAGADGVVQGENLRIDHQSIGLKDGLERGEKITREAHVQEALPNRRFESSTVSRLAPGAVSPDVGVPVSSSVATSGEVVVPVVVSAPAQRLDARFGGSREARGAPSEDPPTPAAVLGAPPAEGDAAPAALPAPATVTAVAVAHAPPRTGALPEARPPSRRAPGDSAAAVQSPGRAPAPAPAAGGLHIGRIEVTVLASPPRAAPAAAAPLADSQFLSRHYLRRT